MLRFWFLLVLFDFRWILVPWFIFWCCPGQSRGRATYTASRPGFISSRGLFFLNLYEVLLIFIVFFFFFPSRVRRRVSAGSPAWGPSPGWNRGCTSTWAAIRSRGCWKRCVHKNGAFSYFLPSTVYSSIGLVSYHQYSRTGLVYRQCSTRYMAGLIYYQYSIRRTNKKYNSNKNVTLTFGGNAKTFGLRPTNMKTVK